VLVCAAAMAAAEQPLTVAVLYFDNNSIQERADYDGLRKGLCDMLITELSKMSGLRVVEREEIEKVFAEIALGQSGAVDPSSAPEVGKLLGAQILTFGSFMAGTGRDIRIDTRLVRVETGEVLKAEEITGSAAKLFKLVKTLSLKISDELDISLSRDERKQIENSDKVTMDALLVYSEGLDLLDKGDRQAALGRFEEALDMDKSFLRAKLQIERIKRTP
jgi:TolB-like protein